MMGCVNPQDKRWFLLLLEKREMGSVTKWLTGYVPYLFFFDESYVPYLNDQSLFFFSAKEDRRNFFPLFESL
jgi:hypothetical protein